MEDYLVLLALIPIAILILMIVLLARLGTVSRELKTTRQSMEALTERLRGSSSSAISPEAPQRTAPPMSAPPPVVSAPPAMAPPPEKPILERTIVVPLEPPPVAITQPARAASTPPPFVVQQPPLRPPSVAPPRPSFFERHPDLEKFIGENLINKIGIAVLVIGIGLLMRYAIGKGLISETARTLIGLAAGGILIFFAHRLRESFRAFSSVLVGGGLAVLYFSIAIAYQQYTDVIAQTPAFLVMVGITGLGVLLTLAYDRKELAVIALLGGFASPFMASNGDGNFRVLFTYILVLDIGMLVLANFKKWHVINILSFVLTLLLFGGWSIVSYTDLQPRPYAMAFVFASAFFLVFFLMNLRYNLRHRQAFGVLDHMLLLVNTAAYYAAGMHLLSDSPLRITGLFTVSIGLFYLVFALYFHKKEGIPRPLKLLLIGLVLTFISLAAPVQLEGSHITLFWAAEAVLLLWFAQRTDLRLVERGSVLVMTLMLGSLWMDLVHVYGWSAAETMTPLFNKGWITGMVCVLSLAGMTLLLRRREASHGLLLGLTAGVMRKVTVVLAVVVLYLANLLELRYQLGRIVDGPVMAMALMGYSLLFLLVLDLLTRSVPRGFRAAIAALFTITALVYITGFYQSSSSALWYLLEKQGARGFFPAHYAALALMVMALVRMAMLAREHVERRTGGWNVYLWAISVFVVVFASQELDHVMLLARQPAGFAFSDALRDARRIGYPILWGVGSFLFMWYGMRQRMRMMRVIALSLFGITLLKLFIFDLGSLSEGGRVAAFIFLGALLLVVSFMYQKLKGLLMEDVPANEQKSDAPQN
ncbi:MAG: DUF2339 domain-containing protein [Flavobacteriales bacterium]